MPRTNSRQLISTPRVALVALGLLGSSGWAFSQATPARRADSVIGEVTSVSAAPGHLGLKADGGDAIDVSVGDGAAILRAKPGAAALSDATPIGLEEIQVGDRVLARGTRSEDRASLAARQVVVMTRGDIAQKQETDRGEWRRRGVLGVVTAVDTAKGEISLEVRRAAAGQALVVDTAGRTVTFRRYASDSVKFSDARPSGIGELHVGDQLRALGDKSADGARLAAEQIVFGTFRTVSGTVAAIDAGRSELTLREAEAKHTLTVAVGPDARVRRLTPEIGARLSRFAGGGGSEGSESGGSAGGPPTGGASRRGGGEGGRGSSPETRATGPGEAVPGADSGGAIGPGGAGSGGASPRRGGRGGGEDLIERLPAAAFADLKVGDRILVASTEGSDPARLNAIAVVAGLETIVVAAGPSRGTRPADVGLPAGLLDLGMAVP